MQEVKEVREETLLSHTIVPISSYPAEAMRTVMTMSGDILVPRSDYLVAYNRGLERPTPAQPGKFRFTNAVGRRDTFGKLTITPYNDFDLDITSVRFNISRYGKYTHTIYFDEPTTVAEAIAAAEEFLSVRITKVWFNSVADDLWHQKPEWEEAQKYFICKGDVLGDSKFIEDIDQDQLGALTLTTNL